MGDDTEDVPWWEDEDLIQVVSESVYSSFRDGRKNEVIWRGIKALTVKQYRRVISHLFASLEASGYMIVKRDR